MPSGTVRTLARFAAQALHHRGDRKRVDSHTSTNSITRDVITRKGRRGSGQPTSCRADETKFLAGSAADLVADVN